MFQRTYRCHNSLPTDYITTTSGYLTIKLTNPSAQVNYGFTLNIKNYGKWSHVLHVCVTVHGAPVKLPLAFFKRVSQVIAQITVICVLSSPLFGISFLTLGHHRFYDVIGLQ